MASRIPKTLTTKLTKEQKTTYIENFLSKAENVVKLHANGTYFMNEAEIHSYLLQLKLLTRLNPEYLQRQHDVKYKLKKILHQYSQIITDISQETSNSNFDVNLLTNTNFLSISSSSDSGITQDIIPETQTSLYETRSRKNKKCFSEYTKHAILTKRYKSMPKNEILNPEIDVLQDSQNFIIENKSLDQSIETSDTESIVFDIENMECDFTNDQNNIITLQSNTKLNKITSPKMNNAKKRLLAIEYTEDIINETQISNFKGVRKNNVSSTEFQSPDITKLNNPSKKIGNFESRYNNSLTNISSSQLTSCATNKTIPTQNFVNTISPSFNTTSSCSMPHTSHNTETILYTALPNNKFVATRDSNSPKNKRLAITSQFGYCETVNYVTNKQRIGLFKAAVNDLPVLDNLLPEDVYFSQSTNSQNFRDNYVVDDVQYFDLVQGKKLVNRIPGDSAVNSTINVFENYTNEPSNKTIRRNEYEINSSEDKSYNEDVNSANKNVLNNLMETQRFSADFRTKLVEDLRNYSDMNECRIQISFQKIEKKAKNPFLCKDRKDLLCEDADFKINERNRNKLVDRNIDTKIDVLADMFRNNIRLADLNKSDLFRKIKHDSNLL